MKKKFLGRVVSVITALTILMTTGAVVLADPESITADGRTYTLDPNDGLYKYVEQGYATTTYIYVSANIIHDKFDDTLPTYTTGDSFCYVNFYFADNVTITHAVTTPDGFYGTYDLNGKTITYDPDKMSACDPLISVSGKNCLVNIKNGNISSPHGDPIMYIEGKDGYSSHGTIANMTVTGFEDTTNKIGFSAVEVGPNGKINVTDSSCIKNFVSTGKGGAINASSATSQIYVSSSSIENCKAEEGGAIYSEGQVDFEGNVSITGNTATVRGGGLCLIGPSVFLSVNDRGTLKVTGNSCSGSNDIDQGGGGVYFSKNSTTHERQENRSFSINGGLKIFDNSSTVTGTKKDLYLRYAGEVYNSINLDSFGMYSDEEPGAITVGVSCGTLSGTTMVAYSGSYREDTIDLNIYYEDSNHIVIPTVKDPSIYKLELSVVDSNNDVPVEVQGFSVAIMDGDSIGVRYHVYMPQSEDIGSASNPIWQAKIGPSSGYSLFVRGSESSTVNIDGFKRDGDFVTFTYYVDSTDMAVPLDFTLYKNGEKIKTVTGFSVKGYLESIMEKSSSYSTYVRRLAMGLANYGGAAQTYFGFMTNNLASEKVASNKYAYELELYDYRVDYDKSTYGTFTYTDSAQGISFYGGTISFKSSPKLKLYFKLDDGVDIKNVVVTDYSTEDEITIHPVSGGKYFYITIDCGISNLNKFTDFVLENKAVANDYGDYMNVCGLWYLLTVAYDNQGRFTPNMKALALALYSCYVYYN